MERAGQIRSPVTVVVPAYNSHGTLHLVLASLERQTYTPLHIVVIDDQPAPNPCDEIIAAFKGRSKHRVTYIKRVNNKGLAAAYNEAANLAQGAHLITLQADVVIPKCDGVARTTTSRPRCCTLLCLARDAMERMGRIRFLAKMPICSPCRQG